jgi:hypothetical protein
MRERGPVGNPVQCLTTVWLCRGGKAEPRHGADCLQRALRSRFRQRLMPSVRRLRRDGSGEEMLYSPSAWAHDNVHP